MPSWLLLLSQLKRGSKRGEKRTRNIYCMKKINNKKEKQTLCDGGIDLSNVRQIHDLMCKIQELICRNFSCYMHIGVIINKKAAV